MGTGKLAKEFGMQQRPPRRHRPLTMGFFASSTLAFPPLRQDSGVATAN